MSAKPWFAWYPADYRAKTGHLTFVESEAYRRLLEAYYERRGPIPMGTSLYRLCGAQDDSERHALDRVSREFFTEKDGMLIHVRCEEEIAKARARHEVWVKAGSKGGLSSAKGRLKAGIKGGSSNPQSQSQSYITSKITTNTANTVAADAAHVRVNGKNRKSSLPEDFGSSFSDSMQTWLQNRGETQVRAHLLHFVGYVKANGKQYADWEQAFKNAIRDDWAGVRKVTT